MKRFCGPYRTVALHDSKIIQKLVQKFFNVEVPNVFCRLHKIFHEFQLMLNIFVVLAKPDKLWLYKFENVAILCMYMVTLSLKSQRQYVIHC